MEIYFTNSTGAVEGVQCIWAANSPLAPRPGASTGCGAGPFPCATGSIDIDQAARVITFTNMAIGGPPARTTLNGEICY